MNDHRILDERRYYYQTKTGSVSNSALSVRQLVRLLCPVREGLQILESNTQCLPVVAQQQQGVSYGEWTAASQIDILREASCNSWFWAKGGTSDPEGPGSCRDLLTLLSKGGANNSSVLVFAKDITPEWTKISELDSLKLALDLYSNRLLYSGRHK